MKGTPVESIYVLTPLQEGLLFDCLSAPTDPLYIVQAVASLRGDVRPDLLEAACNDSVARHPILRTIFHWQRQGRPLQIVRRSVSVPLRQEDWRGLAGNDRRLEAYLAADRAQAFDLTRPPILRLHLLRLAEDQFALVWTSHHILLDGWSLFRLLPELWRAYDARLRGVPFDAPAPPPYRDYVTWLERQDQLQAEAFWRRTFDRFTPATLAQAADAAFARTMQTANRSLSLQASAALQAFAKQRRLTINTVVHGAWAILLSRYARSADVAFGSVTSGRPPSLPRVEEMVGLFVNTLPFRILVRPELPVGDWLQQVQARLLETYEHDYTPLRDIIRWSGVPRDVPLFETGFVFENYPLGDRRGAADTRRSGGFAVDNVELAERPNSLLGLVAGWSDRLWLKAHYDTARFDRATIDGLLGALEALLEAAAADPARPVGTLPALSASSHQRVVEEWNATAQPRPTGCMHTLIEQQAARTPETIAVSCGDQVISYAALNARADRIAQRLIAMGVGPERVVAVAMPRTIDLVVGLLGVWKAGGVYLPLDLEYPADRLQAMVAETDAAHAIAMKDSAAHLPPGLALLLLDAPDSLETTGAAIDKSGASGVSDMSGVSGGTESARPRKGERVSAVSTAILTATATAAPSPALHQKNAAYIIYTSGSTGRPKGTIVAHEAIASLASAVVNRFDTKDAAARSFKLATSASTSFDASIGDIVAALITGTTLVIVPDAARTGLALRDYAVAHKVTHLAVPPVVLADLGDPRDLPVLWLFTAGDACSQELAARWGPGRNMINAYGPTETAVCATMSAPLTGDRPPSIGTPLWNTRAYVLDEGLQPVPARWTGELHLAAAGLARGYLGRPGLTAERFIPDPHGAPGTRMYRTGDLARWSADGEIEFIGRRDHQVKIRGHRVEPAEIEAALASHPAVQTAVVTVQALAGSDKRLVAYVVPIEPAAAPAAASTPVATSTTTLTTASLRAHLQTRVPPYMMPAVFVTLAALPLTPQGKVDRAALPAPAGGRPELDTIYVAPRTPAEQALAAIWSAVLQVAQVGVTDNFFELGGDSILAIQIVARAREAGLSLVPRHLFEHQTIETLARAGGEAPAIVAEQGLPSGEVPLTPIQCWFFAQQLADPQQFNQAQWLAAAMPIDAAVLEAALAAIVVQHDALRLRYRRSDRGWIQEHAAPAESAVPVTRVDLTPVPPAERAAAQAAIAAELQTGLDLTAGPLMRVALCDGAASPALLLIVVHHLLIDIVSWSVLVADLSTACAQLAAGQPVRLPAKTTAFQTWSQRLHAYAASAAMAQERAHWSALASLPAPRLPVDHVIGPNSVASSRAVTLSLTTAETGALLQSVPQAYRTQINDLLLTALGQALTGWSGGTRVRVALEGHGRVPLFDDVDLSRTVGWFTTTHPVVVDLTDSTGPGDAIKRVKEQLRRVPHDGIGYGIWRHIDQGGGGAAAVGTSASEAVAAGALVEDTTVRGAAAESGAVEEDGAADVSFNYLGVIDSAGRAAASGPALFEMVPGPTGADWSPRQTRPCLLQVDALVRDGQLSVRWTYSTHRHADATIRQIAARFIEALRALIAHCLSPEAGGCTPSDFPLSTLRQEDLDRLHALSRPRPSQPLSPEPPSQWQRQPIEDIYPLSALQQEMLVHWLASRESDMGFLQNCWHMRGPIDAAALRQAWQAITDRYAVLRSSFAWEQAGDPVQIVHRGVAIDWRQQDWSDADTSDGSRASHTAEGWLDPLEARPARDEESGRNGPAPALRQRQRHRQRQRLQALLASDRREGFDLARAPLSRICLIRCAPDDHYVLFSAHHILLDGWSQSRIVGDLLAAYAQAAAGQAIASVPVVPYREFIGWTLKQDGAAAEAFWRTQLKGFGRPNPIVSRLAGWRRRRLADDEIDSAARTHDVRLSAAATADLMSWARAHQLTLNSLIKGAWALFVHACTGDRDVLFGTTVSGRTADIAGIETLVGPCISTLPARIDVSAPHDALAWLRDMQARELEAMRWGFVSRAQLQTWKDTRPDLPLFESAVIVETLPEPPAEPPTPAAAHAGAQLPPVQDEEQFGTRTGAPLTLLALPGASLSLLFAYDAGTFSDEAIAEAGRNLERLLFALVAHADQRPAEIVARAALSWPVRDGARRADDERGTAAVEATRGDSRAEAIEALLRAHPEVADAAVLAARAASGSRSGDSHPHLDADLDRDSGGKAAGNLDVDLDTDVAFIVPAGARLPPVSALRAHLRSHVAEASLPTSFVFLDALPRTVAGAIDRPALARIASHSARAHGGATDNAAHDAGGGASAGRQPAFRDAREREIAALWEEILSIRPIGPHDDFFRLGGDSLRALRMLSALADRLGRSCPLSVLVRGRTVRALAELLADAAVPEVAAPASRATALVTVREAGDPQALPFFCVHAAGGNVLSFLELADRLPGGRAFYGLQSIGLDGRQPPYDTLEAIAAHYLAEIRAVQPEGPYLIGGFSFGGFVAFEMARQLKSAGQAVGLLALFDTWSPPIADAAAGAGRRAVAGESLARAALVGQVNLLMRRTAGWTPLDPAAYTGVPAGALLPRLIDIVRGHAASEAFVEQIARLLTLHLANGEALRRYAWPVYDGRLTLFRATEVAPRAEYVMAPATLGDAAAYAGWARLCTQPLACIDVPGTHFTMLTRPHVDALARALDASCSAVGSVIGEPVAGG